MEEIALQYGLDERVPSGAMPRRRPESEPPVANAPDSDEFEMVRRRATPGLYIVDDDLQVVLSSQSVNANLLNQQLDAPRRGNLHLPAAIEATVRRILAADTAGEAKPGPSIALVNATLIVRVARLRGVAGEHIAIFVERFKARDALRGAREKFGFSPRELDVVDQLVQGKSTAEIAEKLVIAETTVQDHVKHIARKSNARNRAEIVARVLGAN